MKKVTFVLLLCVLVGTAACKSEEAGGVTYQAVGGQFVAALFQSRFDDAKAMASADFADAISADVDAFASLLDKYDFQAIPTEATSDSTWSSTNANTDSDRRLTYNYQFRAKGTDTWSIGWLEVRVLSVGGSWGIADLILARPNK